MQEETISYIADVTIEELFSTTVNGMTYGIGTRKTIGKNNGVFNKQYVKSIVESCMDDEDIYDEVGSIGFDYVLKNIPMLCKEYIKNVDQITGGEVLYIKESHKSVYDNTIESLKNIK